MRKTHIRFGGNKTLCRKTTNYTEPLDTMEKELFLQLPASHQCKFCRNIIDNPPPKTVTASDIFEKMTGKKPTGDEWDLKVLGIISLTMKFMAEMKTQ